MTEFEYRCVCSYPAGPHLLHCVAKNADRQEREAPPVKTYFFHPDEGNLRLQVQAVDDQAAAEDAAQRLARRYDACEIVTGLVLIARDCDGLEETWRGCELLNGPCHWHLGFFTQKAKVTK